MMPKSAQVVQGAVRPRRLLDAATSVMTQKGQITISASLRKALGLRPGDTVLIALESDGKLGMERLPSFDEMLASLPLARIEDPAKWVDVDEAGREALADQAVAYRSRPPKS